VACIAAIITTARFLVEPEDDVPEEFSLLDPRGMGKDGLWWGRVDCRMSLTGRRIRWRAIGLVGRIHIYSTVDVDVKRKDALLTMARIS
jgi:hypothetical protein